MPIARRSTVPPLDWNHSMNASISARMFKSTVDQESAWSQPQYAVWHLILLVLAPTNHSIMITLSSPSTQTPPPSDALRVDHGADSDPRIASLKGMFPDFDDTVMYVDVYPISAPTYPLGSLSVLESVDNDHDRALDILLGMNDPTYISSTVPPFSPPQQPGPAQEDLDEQLARRLTVEEEQAARAWSADRQPGWGHPMPPSQDQQQAGYQTYQPRRSSGRGWGSSSWGGWSGAQGQTTQSQGQGGQRDTMAEFQEGFNRIAECEVLFTHSRFSPSYFFVCR